MKKFFKNIKDKLNRGRIQAQGLFKGKKIEESVSWATNDEVTKNDGYNFVEEVKDKLSPAEVKMRENEFNSANNIIRDTKGLDVIDKPINYSFKNQNTDHERVDIELKKGKAFFK